MRRFMPSARRLTTLAGAVFVGVAATAMFAAPASAHSAHVTASACKTTTGKWQVTWQVRNDFANEVTLNELDAKPSAIAGIPNKAVVPAQKSITGTQLVDAKDIDAASLAFVPKWHDNWSSGREIGKPKKGGNCTPCPPAAIGEDKDKGDLDADIRIQVRFGELRKGRPGHGEGDDSPPACERPTPPGNGSGNGGGVPATPKPTATATATATAAPALPVTGAQTGLYAGGAVVLLGAGAALFLVARRRRVKFES